jgi:AmiR/NasT family two-component response regulator
VVSSISNRLLARSDPATTLGSLNLYALAPAAFSEDDLMLAVLFASHAAVVVDAAASQEHLRRAIESRDQIGQAKGILMERFKISADAAFDQLRTASQRLNVKLRDLAVRLAETGEHPFES